MAALTSAMGAAALEDSAPRRLTYFISRTEMSDARIVPAFDALAARSGGRLVVERVADATRADFIWLNTPVKSLAAARGLHLRYLPILFSRLIALTVGVAMSRHTLITATAKSGRSWLR